MALTHKVTAPSLPTATIEYERRWQDQFSNILRLFFNQVTTAVNSEEAKDTLKLTDGVTAPAVVEGAAVIYVDAADGDLKVKFSNGIVKTIVIDT